jgi:hypothetical protein
MTSQYEQAEQELRGKRCTTCNGSGEYDPSDHDSRPGLIGGSYTCPKCQGSGFTAGLMATLREASGVDVPKADIPELVATMPAYSIDTSGMEKDKVTLTPNGYPTKLANYLYDQSMEEAEIFTSPIMDGTLWMIVPKMSMPWVTLISWYDGEKDFNMINLNEKGLDRLVKVLAGVKGNG